MKHTTNTVLKALNRVFENAFIQAHPRKPGMIRLRFENEQTGQYDLALLVMIDRAKETQGIHITPNDQLDLERLLFMSVIDAEKDGFKSIIIHSKGA